MGLKTKKGFDISAFTLKVIACLIMLIDHMTILFTDYGTTIYTAGRAIGRIAMPIFMFFLVEGFFYTKNRWRSLIVLAIFALISEAPFDWAFWGLNYSTESVFYGQNMLVTMFIVYATLMGIDYIRKKFFFGNYAYYSFASAFLIVIGSGAAFLLKTDYSYFGVMVGMGFYFFRFKKMRILIYYVVCLLIYSINGNMIEFVSVLAFLLIFLYNGRQYPKSFAYLTKNGEDITEKYKHKSYYVLKYAFYLFYPLHLTILCLIRFNFAFGI